ncbi:MAG: S41 family peptidase [Prolixibacteraceae bacterium]|jgi:carboxyl-terminal processing protease|nr:S41 family peptidase [Prolixibacteraceae bacterium]
MKNRLRILYPVMLAIAVVVGVFLGSNMQQRTSPLNHPASFFQPDKLSLFLQLIEKDYVDSINKSEIIESVIPSILDKLDPHTTYIPAKNMKAESERMRGNFSGIGVQFVLQDDTVMIVDVVSGGPSKQLGILAGDRIVRVNNDTIAGIGIASDSIVSLLRGEKGTMVNVSIHRLGFSELIEFDIERGEIPLFSVDVSYMITDKIGLIKVNGFAESTHREFVSGINELTKKGAEKLIVDLRGNSGGYLGIVFQMVDEFLSANQLIVYTQGNSRTRKDYLSSDKGIWKEKDVLVLIDEFSASASEIFAGAIQDNDRGLVVGRRSFGKGLVQEQIPFSDGSALRLTVARFYTPSGRSIQKPYDHGNDEYMMDYHNRLVNDELTQKDSIHFNDSLKYYTTEGRLVYGGGGIMPDIFVPIDTVGFNSLYTSIVRKNLVYYFAFDYADIHRAVLNEIEDVWQLNEYLNDVGLFDEFISHAKNEGINVSIAELKEARHILKAQLHAYVCRNIMGDNGFYPVIFTIDKAVAKSVEMLEKEDWSKTEIVKLETSVGLN